MVLRERGREDVYSLFCRIESYEHVLKNKSAAAQQSYGVGSEVSLNVEEFDFDKARIVSEDRASCRAILFVAMIRD